MFWDQHLYFLIKYFNFFKIFLENWIFGLGKYKIIKNFIKIFFKNRKNAKNRGSFLPSLFPLWIREHWTDQK